MAIGPISNAQFDKFVQFANACNDTTVARLDAVDAQGIRSVTVQKDDHVGALRRSAEAKVHNEAARSAFRSAVAALFGGEEHIPQNVKKEMLLGDYGHGKPLTARRILAVKEAVDKAFEAKVDAALKVFSKNVQSITDAQKDLVRTAVAECGNDSELLDIVTSNIYWIVRRGGAYLTPAQVKGKVADLAANLAEARQVANGDETLLKAGFRAVRGLNGKAFPPGMLQTMATAVTAQDASNFAHFKPTADIDELAGGLVSYYRSANAAMQAAGVTQVFEDVHEQKACLAYITAVMVAGCPGASFETLKATLATDAAVNLLACCADLSNKLFTNEDQIFYTTPNEGMHDSREMTEGLRMYSGVEANAMAGMFAQLRETAELAGGANLESVRQAPVARASVDLRSFSTYDVFVGQVVEFGKVRQDCEWLRFKNSVAKGDGAGADRLRDLFGDFVEAKGLYDPNSAVPRACRKGIAFTVRQGIEKNCAELAAGTDAESLAAFAEARAGVPVTLPGGVPLSDDPGQARDQIASLVTGGAKTSFALLDAKEKNVALVAMSLVTRDSARAGVHGTSIALDDKAVALAKAKTTFKAVGSKSTTSRTIALEYAGGSLRISVKSHQDLRRLRFRADEDEAEAFEPEPLPMEWRGPVVQHSVSRSARAERPKLQSGAGVVAAFVEEGKAIEEEERRLAAEREFEDVDAGAGSKLDVEYTLEVKPDGLGRIADTGEFRLADVEVNCSYFKMDAMVN